MSSRIYAAEDDDNIREILRCTLESYGYEVEVFESAAPMLERMRQQLPDLVLMDIMMPEMDGMEALRRMKESAQTREVPVIFLTAKSSEVDKVTQSGRHLDLTLKEYELLRILLSNSSRVVPRDELLGEIWGFDFVGETRTLDMHIKTLRAKLHDDVENPRYIKTIRSVGYKFIG